MRQAIADEEDTNPISPHFNTPTAFRFDGLGRQVETLERNGTAVYSTKFAYDLLDNLIIITDTPGNVKRQSLRRGSSARSSMDDPDRGRMAYTYDDAGNVLATVDAKGQRSIHLRWRQPSDQRERCLDAGRHYARTALSL